VTTRTKTAPPREAPRRFLFEQSFDIARKPAKKKPEEEKPPEPTFSREELEAARQDGYAQGFAAGTEETSESIEASMVRLVETIAARLPELSTAQARANEELLRGGALLATTIARKILPAYTVRYGVEELDALVTQCLQTLIAQPKITIRVHRDNVAAITERMEAAVSASMFEGRFLVEGDETLDRSDCRISWQGGGLERREAEIWLQVEEAMDRFLTKLAERNAVDDEGSGTDDAVYDLPEEPSENETPPMQAAPDDDAAEGAPADPAAARDDLPDPLEDR
jgi:flagellar assembly protein FliH